MSSRIDYEATTTFFSSADFVRALSRAYGPTCQPVAIAVNGSGPGRTMYATQAPARYCTRYISLAAFGLYASPGWDDHDINPSTLTGVLARLRGIRTRKFIWNVRFDHVPLAAALKSLGLASQRTSTQVLQVDQNAERVIARYSPNIRNQVRKARRRGVLVRDAQTSDDVHAYYDVHLRLVRLKQQTGTYGYIHPVNLFLELLKLHGTVRLLLAEWEGRVIGGGVFVRDGGSVIYFHGASDRRHSDLFPLCAVLDEAIRWACDSGATFFNFSGSAGITTLEQFKSHWGARHELDWTFEWSNPHWLRLGRLRTQLLTQLS